MRVPSVLPKAPSGVGGTLNSVTSERFNQKFVVLVHRMLAVSLAWPSRITQYPGCEGHPRSPIFGRSQLTTAHSLEGGSHRSSSGIPKPQDSICLQTCSCQLRLQFRLPFLLDRRSSAMMLTKELDCLRVGRYHRCKLAAVSWEVTSFTIRQAQFKVVNQIGFPERHLGKIPGNGAFGKV